MREVQSLVQSMGVAAGTSLNAFDYDREANEAILHVIETLEVILNCMMNLNYPHDYNMIDSQADPPASSNASRSILNK